ncbi:MAG: hypothetical protein AAGN66_29085 [Acidobacteriota bacterium]
MSVQELNNVHRRYIRVSNHFKAAWTFHQFSQGLRKVFAELSSPQYPADFQAVYGDLKQVSKNLSETTVDQAVHQLDDIERRMSPLVTGLLAADDEVSPGLLRQFFQRVKNYDDNILSQLVKFYLYSQDAETWNQQRLDKADFLATKLAEEYHDSKDAFVLRDQTFLRETVQSFWTALGTPPLSEEATGGLRASIVAFRQEVAEAASVGELHDNAIVQRYRDFKHRLGSKFFSPRVLPELLAANLDLKNHVHRLYKRDEQRIIAEYQHVFELERDVPVDVQLSEELTEFREVVERFERQLEGDDVKLGEIAQLREKVKSLVPRLRPEVDGEEALVAPPEVRREQGLEPSLPSDDSDDYVADQFDDIIAALDDTNPTFEPKRVTLQPEIFGLGLGPREVIAYRRLFGGGVCDRGLETFVLRSAALRARIEQEVDEIKGLLDDTTVTQEAPIFGVARQTCIYADRALHMMSHRIEQCVVAGDGTEAQQLKRLKMRLMRAYSGLWLMVHRL